jgi:hypothetical protein
MHEKSGISPRPNDQTARFHKKSIPQYLAIQMLAPSHPKTAWRIRQKESQRRPSQTATHLLEDPRTFRITLGEVFREAHVDTAVFFFGGNGNGQYFPLGRSENFFMACLVSIGCKFTLQAGAHRGHRLRLGEPKAAPDRTRNKGRGAPVT